MRSARLGFILSLLAMAPCAVAVAQQAPGHAALNALLAPQAGNKACYTRRYDAAHLPTHPKQRITAMTFLLIVQAYDPKPPDAKTADDLVYYSFAMWATPRRQAAAAHRRRLHGQR